MNTATILVAIRPTPGQESCRPGPERVAHQSTGARAALREAALLAGAELKGLDKNEDDAPLPSNGWHWSLSHDAQLVAGALHRAPVGVDLEALAPVRQSLAAHVVSSVERALFPDLDALAFARLWTAKEAVLKMAGCGFAELSHCRVIKVDGAHTLTVAHRGSEHIVRQTCTGSHVIAVTAGGTDWRARFDLGALETPGQLRAQGQN